MDPTIRCEKSDRLLPGGVLVVRAVGLPEESELRSAVTLHLPAGSVQVVDDGTATATLLVVPDEALGVSVWLRQASAAAGQIGPPLYAWNTMASD